MNLFFVTNPEEKPSGEIHRAVQEIMEKKFPAAQTDSIFSLAYDCDDQIFMKTPDGILWGRLYYQKLRVLDIYTLRDEMERLRRTFSQNIQACIFFLEADSEAMEEIPKLPIRPVCFIYSLLESETGRGMAVREYGVEGKERQETYSFFKRARLSREELSELIDLSCSLKILAASPPR